MRKNDGRTYPKCGRKTAAEGVCLSCKSRLPRFTRGYSPLVYRGETAAFINRIKNGTPALAPYFAECMAERLQEEWQDLERFLGEEKLLIVPVPLTEKRRLERGYNQAEELSETLCKRLQESGYGVELDTEILQKTRETAQQKHMDRKARQENVAGAYHVHKRSACEKRAVLLVDDIMTTGATGSECARVLKNAGAEVVYFAVCAALGEMK
jgi:ComF family protein